MQRKILVIIAILVAIIVICGGIFLCAQKQSQAVPTEDFYISSDF